MQVPYVNLGAQHQQDRDLILEKVAALLDSGQFILGDAVHNFEQSFADYCGTKHAVGVANGTDALILTMKAMGIGEGDEVITAPNSFLASASSIHLCGARPVFADVLEDQNIDPTAIEKVIGPRTKAIMPVHLTGRPAAMNEINTIAERHQIKVIEDAAQAVGASYEGKRVGSLAHASCFSLHPLKNLSACGDAGIITTNDDELAAQLRIARNHGLKNRDELAFWSVNSRIDALQAAILNVKMNRIDGWNQRRTQIADRYIAELADLVSVPVYESDKMQPVFHACVIQTEYRDELMQYLQEQGIATKVHYPIPIHLQEGAKNLGYRLGDFPNTEVQMNRILSLPVFPELTDEQVHYVIGSIKNFFSDKKKNMTQSKGHVASA